MATWLKVSTTVTIRLGPFLDATDGVTEETGLSPTVEVSKNHGAFGARSSATAITHDSNGWYAIELNTTDTGTLGPMLVKVDAAATHLPVWREFMVVPANVYDSLITGVEWLPVDAFRPEWATAAGVLTVKKQDDSTTAYTKNLATDAAGLPIVSSS